MAEMMTRDEQEIDVDNRLEVMRAQRERIEVRVAELKAQLARATTDDERAGIAAAIEFWAK